MLCRVCGREGFDICPECQFREQNMQCWRCRMYIPKAEMQQWRGQWICPNCRMETEHEEAEVGEKKKREEEGAEAETHEKKGRCDRCGRETLILYKFNNRNLCWYCLEKEEDYTGAGPSGGAIPVQVTRERKKRKGWLRRIREFFLGKAAGEEAGEEVSVVRIITIKKKGGIAPAKGKEAGAAPAGKEEKDEKKAGREAAPVVRKEKGGPQEEEKQEKGEKKKPEWGQWKAD
ncbi:MAG: hypothetical protein AB1657_00540 [Candidatus Micrarchaeota archaeon]